MAQFYRSEVGAQEVLARYREWLSQWPVPSESLRAPTHLGETFVVVCGRADAPPLVLLHGSASNASMWLGDVATWAPHFCVLAVDVPGEPGLSAAVRPALDSDAHARWLSDVLAHLGIARASFVGISLGGWLALDFATRQPARVAQLALLCPGGVGRQRTGFIFRALPLVLLGGWGRRRLNALMAGPALARDPALTSSPYASFMELVFRHFVPRRERLPVFDDASLRRLSMPLLAILGAHDAILDSADTRRRLEACVPRAEVAWLPEGGHLLVGHAERIRDFLLATGLSPSAA
jgi:pimeloyl-ACP methyl ester carboxylesterase